MFYKGIKGFKKGFSCYGKPDLGVNWGGVFSNGLWVISESKSMRAEGEATFSALVNAAVDGILVINQKGIIRQANPAVTKIFGYRSDELLGNNLNMLMPAGMRLEHDGHLSRHMATGEARIIGIGREVYGLHKNGAKFPLYLSVGRADGEDETLFVGILRDLTDEKQKEKELFHAEQEIRQLISRLAHVSRVSTMGEMAAGIAHEINQPLTAIASYAQTCRRLLGKEEVNLDQLDRALEKINQQALRAGDIIRNMRQWVKQHDIKRESICCNTLILDIKDIAELDEKALEVKLHMQLGEDLPQVIADTVQIQQVVLNLIRNAMESMVDLPVDRRNLGVCVRSELADEARIKVTVIDHGPGIPEGIRNELFTPFFTTKAQGTGLGLAICHSIIAAHGGELRLEPSQEDQGAVFSFTLPTSVEGIA